MKPNDRQLITQTLDALERLMRMFQAERLLYLVGAAASMGLLLLAAYLMVNSKDGVNFSQLGLIFGSTGIAAVTGARIAYFLNKSFNLVEDVLRTIGGLGPRRDP